MTGRPTSFLDVRRLALAFGGVRAIDDLSFQVRHGEVLALIGPNGAGKTSVLNVVTRVFDATAGHVYFEDQDIGSLPREAIARLGIARTFQNIELFEGATVLDNLMLGRHRFGHGAWWAQVLRLPAAVPFLFASAKVAIATSLVGAIVGELPTGAQAGLGARLLSGSYFGQTIQIWSALLMASLLGVGLVAAVAVLERATLRLMGARA